MVTITDLLVFSKVRQKELSFFIPLSSINSTALSSIFKQSFICDIFPFLAKEYQLLAELYNNESEPIYLNSKSDNLETQLLSKSAGVLSLFLCLIKDAIAFLSLLFIFQLAANGLAMRSVPKGIAYRCC